MLDDTKTDLQKKYLDKLQQATPPAWVLEMIEHYRRTGGYRPKDLRRLLGDPTVGVEVGANTSLSSLVLGARKK